MYIAKRFGNLSSSLTNNFKMSFYGSPQHPVPEIIFVGTAHDELPYGLGSIKHIPQIRSIIFFRQRRPPLELQGFFGDGMDCGVLSWRRGGPPDQISSLVLRSCPSNHTSSSERRRQRLLEYPHHFRGESLHAKLTRIVKILRFSIGDRNQ